MNRIKRVFQLIHLTLWTLLALLTVLQLNDKGTNWIQLATAFFLTALYTFYSHFFILTHYSSKTHKKVYFRLLLAIILSGPLLYLAFHYKKMESWDSFSEYYFICMISIVLPFIFLSWLARITQTLVINTVKKEELEKQAVEAELYYLKSQINPHFLFNTLNNIYALVYKQADSAPGAVLQMASLMRYMIYESNADTVPLTREIEYLQDYISLQQLRYTEDPVVDLKTEGDIESANVAPLLFIHLLENAFKHSPARLQRRDIQVGVSVKEGMLIFSVRNPVNLNRSQVTEEPGGIGSPNVRKRLALLYPGKHELQTESKGDEFLIVCKLYDVQIKHNARKADLLRN